MDPELTHAERAIFLAKWFDCRTAMKPGRHGPLGEPPLTASECNDIASRQAHQAVLDYRDYIRSLPLTDLADHQRMAVDVWQNPAPTTFPDIAEPSAHFPYPKAT